MSKQAPKTAARSKAPVYPPVNLVDGIPDRRPGGGRWLLILIAVVFLLWLAFLVYCQVAGRK